MTYKHIMVVITLKRLKRGNRLRDRIGGFPSPCLGRTSCSANRFYLAQPEGDNAVEMSTYFRMAQDSWRFPLFF